MSLKTYKKETHKQTQPVLSYPQILLVKLTLFFLSLAQVISFHCLQLTNLIYQKIVNIYLELKKNAKI